MRTLLGAMMIAFSLGAGSVQATNTRAVIESVSPALPDGVRIDVVGADSYLRVRSSGHDVSIPGYGGEPYLRIAADGTTRMNDASRSAVLNRDRWGSSAGDAVLPAGEPKWRTTGTSGEVLWHDHRIHWMSRSTPPVIDEKGTVLEFVVPLVVDGNEHIVSGSLTLHDEALILWWGFGVAALAGATVLARRRRSLLVPVAAVVALSGTAVGVHEWLGMPSGARITPVLAGFSALASVCIVAARFASSRRARDVAGAFAAGGGASMALAGVLCAEQVRSAWVPGVAAAWEARVVVPVLLATGIVACVDAVAVMLRAPSPTAVPSRD